MNKAGSGFVSFVCFLLYLRDFILHLSLILGGGGGGVRGGGRGGIYANAGYIKISLQVPKGLTLIPSSPSIATDPTKEESTSNNNYSII